MNIIFAGCTDRWNEDSQLHQRMDKEHHTLEIMQNTGRGRHTAKFGQSAKAERKNKTIRL